MDATTTTAALLENFGAPESLYNQITRRIRECKTLFGEQVKLVLRQLDDEHWALMKPPYLLVVPTTTRPAPRQVDQDYDSFINPRNVSLIAQLDAKGSEAEWEAANDIELAEKELMSCLVNWRPMYWYKPTAYAGMRVIGTKAPAVKVVFVFTFYEEIVVCDAVGDQGCSELGRVFVKLRSGCEVVPCTPPCSTGTPKPVKVYQPLKDQTDGESDDENTDENAHAVAQAADDAAV